MNSVVTSAWPYHIVQGLPRVLFAIAFGCFIVLLSHKLKSYNLRFIGSILVAFLCSNQ